MQNTSPIGNFDIWYYIRTRCEPSALLFLPNTICERFISFLFVLGTSNGCKCINIYKCHALLDLLRVFGKAAGDFVTEVHCGFEGQDPMVCCPLGNNGDLITPSNRRHITARPVNGPSVLQLRMQNLEDDFAKAESDHCGFSDAQHKRIVGGVPAQRGPVDFG